MIIRPEIGVWAVADGMGGHKHGRRASELIVEGLGALRPELGIEGMCRVTADAIHAANGRIYDEATASGESMGSTVVCLVLSGSEFAVIWAGDSRAYLVRGGELLQLSRDHTQVQEMIDRGLLSEAEGKNHPMGHVLSRAVGVEGSLELDVIVDEREEGDLFLLCSDGLHGVVSETDIIAALSDASLDVACDELIARCHAAGAPDNVTVIAVTGEPTTVLVLADHAMAPS
jgi:serine/threonine protein phosphatase PrpC